jgi:uncharacterized protein (TIGR03790 family)
MVRPKTSAFVVVTLLVSSVVAFACGDAETDPATPSVAMDGSAAPSPIEAALDAAIPDATGTDAGVRSLDPSSFELTEIVDENGRKVTVGLPRVAVTKSEMAVVVNRRDPQSVAVAAHYLAARGLAANHRIEVDFDPAVAMTPEAWKPIKDSIDLQADTLGGVEALAVSWTRPWEVRGESITSAVTFGYDPKYVSTGTCSPTQPSPLYDEDSPRPFAQSRMRPSMMLAGQDVARVRTLIDRAVSADRTFPRGSGYFVRTSDGTRSARFGALRGAVEAFSSPWAPLDLHYVESKSAASDSVTNVSDVLFYFTGLQQVTGLETLTFRPGAVADHLTSFGGVLEGGGQMSILRWLEAGASASYGTVREPCAYPEKFPAPNRVVDHLLHGRTALEAYWASVKWPGEGLFVGDPMTRPYGGYVTASGKNVKLHAGALRGGHRYEMVSGPSWNGPWKTQKTWTVATDKLTFEELDALADDALVLLVDKGPEPPAATLDAADFAIADRTVLYARAGEPWIAEPGRVQERRLAWWRKNASSFALTSDAKRAAWISAGQSSRIEIEDLGTREHRSLLVPAMADGSEATATGLTLDGDRLLWSDDRFGNRDIFAYSWAGNEVSRITSASAGEHSPAVSGNTAAWTHQEASGTGIAVYDFTSKTERLLPVPPATYSEFLPRLDGDWLVWSRGSNVDLVGQSFRARVSALPAKEELFPGRNDYGRVDVAGDTALFCDSSSGRHHVWSRSPQGLKRLTPFEGAASCDVALSTKLVGWKSGANRLFLRAEPGIVGGVELAAPSDGASARSAEVIVRHVRASDPSTTFEATLLDGSGLSSLGATLSSSKAGDTNADGVVDARDAAFVSAALGRRKGSPNYDGRADLDDDGEITSLDVAMQASDASRGGTVGLFTLPAPASLATTPVVVRFVAKLGGAEVARASVRFEANAAPEFHGIRTLTVQAGARLTAHVWATDADASDLVETLDDVPSVGWATLGAKVGKGPLGDLDENGVVNSSDVGKTRALLGSVRGDGRYDARADFDDDGDIDQADMTLFATYVGSRSWTVDWTPSAAQKGTYTVRFEAWDRRTEVVTRELRIVVE